MQQCCCGVYLCVVLFSTKKLKMYVIAYLEQILIFLRVSNGIKLYNRIYVCL